MAVPCPTCGKDVDPLRAPAVRVIAGKITAYCSAECADQLPKAAQAISLSPAKKRAASVGPAAVDVVEAPVPVARSRRPRLVIWLIAGIVVGGMAVAIIQATSPSSPTPVEAKPAVAGSGDAGPTDAASP